MPGGAGGVAKQSAAAKRNLDTAMKYCALIEDTSMENTDRIVELFDPTATYVTLSGGVIRSLGGIRSAVTFERKHHWTTFRALRQVTDNSFERTGHLQRKDHYVDYIRFLEVRESILIVDGKITMRTIQCLPTTGNSGRQFIL